MKSHPIKNAEVAKSFLLAWRATVTFRSLKTGDHLTYQIVAPKSGPGAGTPRFVRVLTGPENTKDYTFLGTIFADGNFVHGSHSSISSTAKSSRAFAWAWNRLSIGSIPADLEIWHEGRCGCCGRKLTVPESLETGIGPVCSNR